MPVWVANALLFAAPFAIYFGWRVLRPPGAADGPVRPRLVLLALAGLALTGAGMAAWGLSRRAGPGGVYVPPRALPDGTVAPARTEPRP